MDRIHIVPAGTLEWANYDRNVRYGDTWAQFLILLRTNDFEAIIFCGKKVNGIADLGLQQ